MDYRGRLCVFPLIVYFVSAVIVGRDSLFPALLSPWAKIALFLDSAVNPIIYFWRHTSMRSAALALVRSQPDSLTPPPPPFISAEIKNLLLFQISVLLLPTYIASG